MNKQEVIGILEWAIEQIEDDPREGWFEEDALEAVGPTDEEIAMNIKGDPDWPKERPNQFASMRHLYDPMREPFTANQFHLYGRFSGVDTRAWKPQVIETKEYPDGVLVRNGATKQYGAPYDPYYKDRYVIDDDGKWWYRA